MSAELVNFWKKYDGTSAPYVHPDDLPILERERHAELTAVSFPDYISGPRFGDFTDHRFHLSLLPAPYGGDLTNADIFILLLNPGFNYVDYYAAREPAFRSRIDASLKQEFSHDEFPFYFLDPQLCWHSGFVWWEKKLRAVLWEIATNKFKGRYIEAMRDLSRRLAFVELIPYHSPAFSAHKLLNSLPSVKAVKNYAKNSLLPAANAGEKTIIITRQAAVWGIAQESRNVVIYSGGLTRGASLGPDTPGGLAILRRYGLR